MAKKFLFTIISADGKSFEAQIDELNVETTDGVVGILAGHLPLVAHLKISNFNIKIDNSFKYFAITGGILSVEKDKTIILADAFEESSEIDKKRVLRAKERAENRLNGLALNDNDFDRKRAELALERALNRLKILK